jgi:hypothetical protein
MQHVETRQPTQPTLPRVKKVPVGRTAWLSDQVTRLHFGRFLTLWISGLAITLVALGVLLAALSPRLIYLGEALGSYQPGTYSMQGRFSWPGEDAAHQSTVILTYTDRLTVVTIPAGSLARMGSFQSDTQRGQAPRIEGVTEVTLQGKPALQVSVNLNYLSLFADTVTFTLASNSAHMSADPTSPNYRAPGFVLVKGALT